MSVVPVVDVDGLSREPADRDPVGACTAWIEWVESARLYLAHLGRPLQIPELTPKPIAWSAALDVLAVALDRLELDRPCIGSNGADALELLFAQQTQQLALNVFRACGEDLQLLRNALSGALADRQPLRVLRNVEVRDGVVLETFCAGDPSNPAVVLLGPCAIPTAILDNWIRALVPHFHVITFETRGFSSLDVPRCDRNLGLLAQASDVVDVMDEYGVRRAHVMAICGAAVVALQIATSHPDRFDSLSLWHGDFNLGEDEAMTRYQSDLKWLMDFAGTSREEAQALQRTLLGTEAVERVRAELAHLLLFPFSSAELLYRYALANREIMNADVCALARSVAHRTCVVTSAEDQTAHPEGSCRVARLLTRGSLHMQNGEHLALFEAREPAVNLLRRFIASG